MFEVTEIAKNRLKELLKGKKDGSAVRIMSCVGGWGTPALAMALDEPGDGDKIVQHDGLTFVIDALLLETAQPIRIDLTKTDTEAEFSVSSTILENNCSLAESPSSCYASCTI